MLKTNHDCGGVVLVSDKDALLSDSVKFNQALAKLTNHLNTNYYKVSREWHYNDIEPRIFAEEFLSKGDNQVPIDYKIHTMGTNISHIEIILDRFKDQKEVAMNELWEKMPFTYEKDTNSIPPKPINLNTMLHIARVLGADLGYVRVDLYEFCSMIYVGELTFTPAGGTDKFNPPEWDKVLGDRWK